MFDDDSSGEGRNNDSASGYSSLVFRTQRVLAVSYALEERLRATGHTWFTRGGGSTCPRLSIGRRCLSACRANRRRTLASSAVSGRLASPARSARRWATLARSRWRAQSRTGAAAASAP